MAVLIGKKNQNIRFHLATEEYLLRHYDLKEDVLYIWFGSSAFVFGRNQNPFIEIHPSHLKNQSIDKLRRISGGGTIYEDEGTLNFSIITKNYKNKINDYQYFLKPLINYLNKLGIRAVFKAKTHVFIDENKISGNAQAFINNRLMHHGTILYDTDLSIIKEALVDHSLVAWGHQVLSNKQKVTNIKPYLSCDKDKFVNNLVQSYCEMLNINYQPILGLDEDKIAQIVEEKYLTWRWNFGATPSFDIGVKYNNHDITLNIEKGIIKSVNQTAFRSFIGQRFDFDKFK